MGEGGGSFPYQYSGFPPVLFQDHEIFVRHTVLGTIPYSGKLLREKTFVNFEVLQLSAKVFFAKKILFSANSQKFSPSKVFRYTVLPLRLHQNQSSRT